MLTGFLITIKSTLTFLAALLLAPLSALHAAETPKPKVVEAAAKPPAWAAKGAYVFRVSTPDTDEVLPRLEEGHAIVANLLDHSVPQITIVNGLIGHDHPGPWNWDGLWPYWNRTTFRAGGFEKLAAFMKRAKEQSNVHTGFHLNITDVNIGLRDYPESRAFFQKLVETKSIYRRDWDTTANKRAGTPFVPNEIDRHSSAKPGQPLDPVQIFALVNYKQFWDSGLAKEMINGFYAKLPFAPPMLYLDVLNAGGGNFATGFPDGPLGGSEQTQIEGMQAIADYLRSKGTDQGTEGNRHFLGTNAQGSPRAGYVWLHGSGFSADDYSVITGGSTTRFASHHVYGNPGAFNVSPVASTAVGLQVVRTHYAALLAGKPGTKPVAGQETLHIAFRTQKDAFDIPGTGDPFRGDWADLVNNFYLTTIQELYHIGNRSVRQRFDSISHVHLGKYTVAGPGGVTEVSVPDFHPLEWARPAAQKIGRVMIEGTMTTRVNVKQHGKHRLKVTCYLGGRSDNPQLGIYVNGRHHRNFDHLPIPGGQPYELDAGEVELQAGENTIAFDSGVIRAKWSDGVEAEWTTPSLRTGFKAWKGDVVFAEGYDRMWPDTWSGQKKIYFFSWDGTQRSWKLPAEWSSMTKAVLHTLTPKGRGPDVPMAIKDGAVAPSLLPQVPYILIPEAS